LIGVPVLAGRALCPQRAQGENDIFGPQRAPEKHRRSVGVLHRAGKGRAIRALAGIDDVANRFEATPAARLAAQAMKNGFDGQRACFGRRSDFPVAITVAKANEHSETSNPARTTVVQGRRENPKKRRGI
jgi:hypothetical protein